METIFNAAGAVHESNSVEPDSRSPPFLFLGKDGWGDVRPEDILTILLAVAEEFYVYFPEGEERCFIVAPTTTAYAFIRHETGPKGEAIIQLSTVNDYWAGYAYHFAHELCHALCHFERTNPSINPNHWFEESLCEAASLFVLKQLALTWATAPPQPHWMPYAEKFAECAEQWEASWELPPKPHKIDLAYWYRYSQKSLRTDPYQRSKNALVALRLLPLFEADPENWGALTTLNSGEQYATKTFEAYLRDWHAHSHEDFQGFIVQIANLFAVEVKGEAGT